VPANPNQENKKLVWNLWAHMDASSPEVLREYGEGSLAADLVFHGHDPVNDLHGREAFFELFWAPLKRSFPDLVRKSFLFLGGKSNGRIDGDETRDGRWWVSGTGVLSGTFSKDYLGMPASGTRVNVRWGEFCRLEGGQVREIFFLVDMVDLMEQAGILVLPPSKGKPGIYPPPAAGDGVLLGAQDAGQSQHTLAHIRRFIFEGLNRFDQSELKSMGMADFFHPSVHWYGPGGIGACLSFREFEDLHQRPWLVAFPDRSVQNLDALFAEGHYSAAPGWAGVLATHRGPYLGVEPTNVRLSINGLDWWKLQGDQYVENWVFVDMVHLFRQMGVDLMARIPRRK